jgi:hypothetical protein
LGYNKGGKKVGCTISASDCFIIASFAPRALGGDTDTPADIEMEGVGPDLVTALGSASLDFAEDATQRITL